MNIIPTNDVNQYEWKHMSVEELLEQKYKLYNRYEVMMRTNRRAANTILKGIYELDAIISKR